jgi:hypothetical protein
MAPFATLIQAGDGSGGTSRAHELLVLLENGLGIEMGPIQRADRLVIVMAGKKVIGLGAHDHFDGYIVSHIVFFGDERGYFVEMFFVGHC